MNKFLLTTSISLLSIAAFAEPVQVQQIPATETEKATTSVYQKQTIVRYNVPTNKVTRTTTTVNRVVKGMPSVTLNQESENAVITTNSAYSAANSSYKMTEQKSSETYSGMYSSMNESSSLHKDQDQIYQTKSCVFNNHKYAISNPLFVLRKGQFSTDTVAGYFIQPKDLTYVGYNTVTKEHDYSGRYAFKEWNIAEQIMYGINDWLSIKLQGGYYANRPKKSTWYLVNNGKDPAPVPHNYSYDATVGLQAHAVDTCNFDLIVGVDATWGKAGYKQGDCKDSENYKLVTPYAIMGTQITQYVTPYLQAGYTFAVDTDKEIADDSYTLQPGFYIQPVKYFAIHPYIAKTEHEKPEWNLAFDFYPYQNLVVGVEGTAVSWDKNPMGLYGISGHLKMTF